MKTELQRLQKAIDQCNYNKGCNVHCSKSNQKVCTKLIKHAARMDYCRQHELSITEW